MYLIEIEKTGANNKQTAVRIFRRDPQASDKTLLIGKLIAERVYDGDPPGLYFTETCAYIPLEDVKP